MKPKIKIERLPDNPIICPEMDGGIGININGPSLIRVPDWVPSPRGRYYLYFASHAGKYIRLAYADRVGGPWTVYDPGTLTLEQSYCQGHIASPDVHVDSESQTIRMYYHGPVSEEDCQKGPSHPNWINQRTRVALSNDGIHFQARPEVLGGSYFRVFQWEGMYYALVMPGVFVRSADGLSQFEVGPDCFTPSMRHSALLRRGSTLYVFYSNAGDCPEHLLCATVELTPDWHRWSASEPVSVLFPETGYEGGDLPLEPSQRGLARERVRQLRDPAVFEEDDKTWLLYSIAGESGIAVARLSL